METYLPVVNFEGLYEVSNYGQFRSLSRTVKRKDGKTNFYKGKQLKQKVTHKGYFSICLCKDGEHEHFQSHRLVAEAFIVKAHVSHNIVNHLDGNKKNNNIGNLEWTTSKGNFEHAVQAGLITRCPRRLFGKPATGKAA